VNLLLLNEQDFVKEQQVEISGRRFLHLKKIVRAQKGHTLPAGKLNGLLGQATVIEIDNDSMRLQLCLTETAPPPAACTLILALPRPLMCKRILQSVTALGVKQIHFIHSRHVEKSYWHSADLKERVIHQQLLLGLEQAMDTVLPQVFFHKYFLSFIRHTLPSLSDTQQNFLAQPGSHQACPANVTDPFLLAIGPESGFSTEEQDAFLQTGFQPVHIGQRTLRVETAVTALLGKMLPL
jgi:RsmE family RNA methyltransferase